MEWWSKKSNVNIRMIYIFLNFQFVHYCSHRSYIKVALKPPSEARQAEPSSRKYWNGEVGLNRHHEITNKIHINKIPFASIWCYKAEFIHRRRHSFLYCLPCLGLQHASIAMILVLRRPKQSTYISFSQSLQKNGMKKHIYTACRWHLNQISIEHNKLQEKWNSNILGVETWISKIGVSRGPLRLLHASFVVVLSGGWHMSGKWNQLEGCSRSKTDNWRVLHYNPALSLSPK